MNFINGHAFLFTLVLLLLFYLIGSIPTSFVLGKIIKKIDIRKYGSGNVGATNALRVLGWKIGVIALLFDMFKGFIVIFVAQIVFPEFRLMILASGIAVIFGHIFTVFLKFKGGKGVATSAGVFIALSPLASVIALIAFFVITIFTKYVSLGSITGASVLLISKVIITINNNFENIEYLLITFIVAAFIVYKHKDNIKRILNNTENKISFKKTMDTNEM